MCELQPSHHALPMMTANCVNSMFASVTSLLCSLDSVHLDLFLKSFTIGETNAYPSSECVTNFDSLLLSAFDIVNCSRFTLRYQYCALVLGFRFPILAQNLSQNSNAKSAFLILHGAEGRSAICAIFVVIVTTHKPCSVPQTRRVQYSPVLYSTVQYDILPFVGGTCYHNILEITVYSTAQYCIVRFLVLYRTCSGTVLYCTESTKRSTNQSTVDCRFGRVQVHSTRFQWMQQIRNDKPRQIYLSIFS